MSLPRTWLLPALLAVVLAGGCGDDGADDDSQPTTEAAEEGKPDDEAAADDEVVIVEVIDAFHAAVDDADGAGACALLTEDLQDKYAQNEGASDCASGIEQLNEELAGIKMSDLEFDPADVKVDGDEAVISFEAIAERNDLDPDATDSYHLKRPEGEWLLSFIG